MPSKKILIIEDDRDIRRLLKRLFEAYGYAVDQAENGQVALEILRSNPELPAVIILDLMMPVMDGFQFREEQLKIASVAGIPVVILTADGCIDEKRVKVGAHAALRKPADAEVLMGVVKRFCS